jgi:hypothetical protein
MAIRKNVVRAAALAALAYAGVGVGFAPSQAFGGEAQSPASGQSSQRSLGLPEFSLGQPLYLASGAGEEQKGRKPLMSVLDRTGAATMLDEWGIDVSGHVEASYTWSESSPPDGELHEDFINARVFDDQHDEFYWNQFDITIQRTLTADNDATTGYADRMNVGFMVNYIYGQDARLIHANGTTDHDLDDASRNEEDDLTQLYVTLGLPVGNGLLITAGKFVTPIGYELINPTLNPLYSHSFLFGYAIPFTHTGVLAKYNFTESMNATFGVVRGWDQAADDNNDDPSYIGQIAYTYNPGAAGSEPYNIILTGITGPEQTDSQGNYRTLIDLIVSHKVSDQLTLAVNADLGYEDDVGDSFDEDSADGDDAWWYGVAGYAQYAWSEQISVNGRIEWFNDTDGARGLNANVYEATLGLAIKPFPDNDLGAGLVVRPEVRYDYASDDILDGGTDHDQLTFAVDAIFAF